MINDRIFTQYATEAKECIVKGRLHDALSLLASLTNALGNNQLSEARETINADYERLLQFMRQNGKDESRAYQHRRLIQKTICLLQDVRRLHRLQRQSDIYSRTWNRYPTPWDNGVSEALAAVAKSNTVQDDIFNLLWTSPQLNSESKDVVANILESNPSGDTPYYISALTLALLEYFDPEKLDLLLTYCNVEDAQLRSRALVGVCISSQLYSAYINFFPNLTKAFDSLDLNDEIRIVQRDFCMYQETERIHRRIQQDILPRLLNSQEQRKKLGFEITEINLQDAASKVDKKTRKQINESIHEMMGMFMEGVDFNIETFGSMKKFPFFQEPCHWFMQFKDQYENEATRESIRNLKLCDSDKFSFCMLVDALPNEQKEEVKRHMIEGMANFSEARRKENATEEAYHNVIQCLSRCLRRSPWSADWPAVFSPQTIFINNPLLKKKLTKDAIYLYKVGASLLRYRRYADAKQHFLLLRRLIGPSTELLSDIATCEENEGNLQNATDYIVEAIELEPENKTLYNRLQSYLAVLEQYVAQLDCLEEMEKRFPDDEDVLVDMGLCLMQMERWKEAKNKFLQLELNEKKVVPSIRAVAWCALQMKDFELANRYYHRLLEEMPHKVNWEDYLNCGHTEWLLGNVANALDLYYRYVDKYLSSEHDVKNALTPFDNDARVLKKLGVSQSDIYLLHDIIARGRDFKTNL